MKQVLLGLVLFNLIFTLACIRVEVKIPQSPEVSKPQRHIPGGIEDDPEPPENEGVATLPSNLPQNTHTNTCLDSRNNTAAVAQEWGVWCWAASAKGIMAFHKLSLDQCAIVNKTRGGDVTTSSGNPFCCETSNAYEQQCQQNGYPDEVFDAFGIAYGWWRPALSHRAVKYQLCNNGPFSYVIGYEGGGGHSFVVKDYRMDGGQMFLLVDQHAYYTDDSGRRYPAGFKERSYEEYVEGWLDGIQHTLDYSLYQINPS